MNIIFHIPRWVAIATPLLSSLASAADQPFASVTQNVQEQTGRNVAWQLDSGAREQAQTQVRAALRRPLTLPVAVQIALLNNRGLQATFEEIGLSHADRGRLGCSRIPRWISPRNSRTARRVPPSSSGPWRKTLWRW